jgi:hypothetical protein
MLNNAWNPPFGLATTLVTFCSGGPAFRRTGAATSSAPPRAFFTVLLRVAQFYHERLWSAARQLTGRTPER